MTCVTQSWRQLTDDVWTGPTVHGPWINVVALGNVIVDSGLRWSHRRVARLLRGPEGTPVRLTLKREGTAAPVTVSVKRKTIRTEQ